MFNARKLKLNTLWFPPTITNTISTNTLSNVTKNITYYCYYHVIIVLTGIKDISYFISVLDQTAPIKYFDYQKKKKNLHPVRLCLYH